jgi:hypothetical protein
VGGRGALDRRSAGDYSGRRSYSRHDQVCACRPCRGGNARRKSRMCRDRARARARGGGHDHGEALLSWARPAGVEAEGCRSRSRRTSRICGDGVWAGEFLCSINIVSVRSRDVANLWAVVLLRREEEQIHGVDMVLEEAEAGRLRLPFAAACVLSDCPRSSRGGRKAQAVVLRHISSAHRLR